jgi:hypothetical protein
MKKMKKILRILFSVYSVFCMCMTAILLIAAIVLWVNFGKITTFLVDTFPEIQPFLF